MDRRRPSSFATALVAVMVVMTLATPGLASTTDPADGLGPFVDVDGDPEEESIAALWAAGITSGCGTWLFCPDDIVSRGEVAAFIVRALELPPGEPEFADAVGSPFASAIGALVAADITDGCRVDAFCPTAAVTRGQLATLLSRALGLPETDQDPFVDDDGSVHEDGISRLAAAGIVTGCDTDLFCPHRGVTRREVAAILTRVLGLVPPSPMPAIPSMVVEDHFIATFDVDWTGGVEAWRPLVEVFFEASDVDRALRVMACESTGDPAAVNTRSGAAGLFQHLPRFWEERSALAGWGGSDPLDPVANVAVAAWLASDDAIGGWHHWVCTG